MLSSLARWIYPDLDRSTRKKKVRAFCLTILVGVAAAGLFGLTMWLLNKPGVAPARRELPITPQFPPPKR